MFGRVCAFLASSKSLKVCVIKCFFSGENDQNDDDKRKSREKFRNHEAKCWGETYLNYSCRKVTVFKRPAIIMQYFSFIDVNDRRGLLDAVRKTLTEDYDKRGWVHRDVKWRNIGQDPQGNVFDMGSVERKKTVGERCEGWVERAITELEKRCGVSQACKVLNFPSLSSFSSSSSSSSSSMIVDYAETT